MTAATPASSSRRWPGIVIDDGPPFAGDDDGRAFAVDVGGVVYLREADQPGPTLTSFRPRDPAELAARSPASQMLFATDEGWLHVRGDGDVVALAGGDVVVCGPRRLRLVDDLGVVVRRRRVGDRVLVRPRGPWPLGLRPQSLWTLADDPAHDVLVSGASPASIHALSLRRRHVGVAYEDIAGNVDARVARALARGSRKTLREAGVTFDGVIVPGVGLAQPEELFAVLTRDSGGAYDGPAADIDEVAAFVRSFNAVGWQREALLREECAIAAAA